MHLDAAVRGLLLRGAQLVMGDPTDVRVVGWVLVPTPTAHIGEGVIA